MRQHPNPTFDDSSLSDNTRIMRVAIAQITTDPGWFIENTEKIINYIGDARAAGAEAVVFPELAVSGYASMDLVYNDGFLKQSDESLVKIAAASSGITTLVGFIDYEADKVGPNGFPILFNSVAVIVDGEIVAKQPKTLLPHYDIFYESRYFSPGFNIGAIEIKGKKLGIGVCEDMWDRGYARKVYPPLIEDGAEILFAPSASPFNLEKFSERIKVISKLIAKCNAPLIFPNLVGAFDGYEGEVVFDGRSMTFNSKGELCYLAPAFVEDLVVLDTDNLKPIETPEFSEDEELFNALVFGIREYFRRNGFERAYIGLSGGIDSALVAALAVEALGEEKVIGVTMPSEITSNATRSDALKLSDNLKIRCDVRPISGEMKAWDSGFKDALKKDPEDVTSQNKQARIRGSILMEYSNEDRNGLVISTGNKTELALGYCTLYGDMCGGFAAISDVSKARVYALSNFINQRSDTEIIPQSIIDRAPTAELREDQTDADNLPADYPILSPLVEKLVDEEQPPTSLYEEYGKTIVDKTYHLILVNEFKRRQAAPGIRVTKKAFGIGRRIPMDYKG